MTLPASANIPNYPVFANARQYDAEWLRMLMQALIGHSTSAEGIAGASTDLKATTASSGLTLNVPAGRAFVKGDDRTTQGTYFVYNDTTRQVTASTAHATLPRIDRVILRVYDADVSGANTNWAIEITAGTPTSGATLSNLNGAASVPNGALLLANLLVPAAFAGPFVDATHLQDRRFGLPIAGRELFGGTSSRTSSLSAAGDVHSNTVVGDGITSVAVDHGARYMGTTAGAAALLSLNLYDGASGSGTQYAGISMSNIGAGYALPASFVTRLAAFSGSKTFYVNLSVNSGTPSLTAASTTPSTVRYTWAA